MLRVILLLLVLTYVTDDTIAQSVDTLPSDTTAAHTNDSVEDEEFNMLLFGLFFSTIALSLAIGSSSRHPDHQKSLAGIDEAL